MCGGRLRRGSSSSQSSVRFATRSVVSHALVLFYIEPTFPRMYGVLNIDCCPEYCQKGASGLLQDTRPEETEVSSVAGIYIGILLE